jgi:hypothetical protein
MHNVESRRDELESARGPDGGPPSGPQGGAFPWVLPLIFVVFVLALSWTGVFIVVNDFVEAASHTGLTMDTLHE